MREPEFNFFKKSISIEHKTQNNKQAIKILFSIGLVILSCLSLSSILNNKSNGNNTVYLNSSKDTISINLPVSNNPFIKNEKVLNISPKPSIIESSSIKKVNETNKDKVNSQIITYSKDCNQANGCEILDVKEKHQLKDINFEKYGINTKIKMCNESTINGNSIPCELIPIAKQLNGINKQ